MSSKLLITLISNHFITPEFLLTKIETCQNLIESDYDFNQFDVMQSFIIVTLRCSDFNLELTEILMTKLMKSTLTASEKLTCLNTLSKTKKGTTLGALFAFSETIMAHYFKLLESLHQNGVSKKDLYDHISMVLMNEKTTLGMLIAENGNTKGVRAYCKFIIFLYSGKNRISSKALKELLKIQDTRYNGTLGHFIYWYTNKAFSHYIDILGALYQKKPNYVYSVMGLPDKENNTLVHELISASDTYFANKLYSRNLIPEKQHVFLFKELTRPSDFTLKLNDLESVRAFFKVIIAKYNSHHIIYACNKLKSKREYLIECLPQLGECLLQLDGHNRRIPFVEYINYCESLITTKPDLNIKILTAIDAVFKKISKQNMFEFDMKLYFKLLDSIRTSSPSLPYITYLSYLKTVLYKKSGKVRSIFLKDILNFLSSWPDLGEEGQMAISELLDFDLTLIHGYYWDKKLLFTAAYYDLIPLKKLNTLKSNIGNPKKLIYNYISELPQEEKRLVLKKINENSSPRIVQFNIWMNEVGRFEKNYAQLMKNDYILLTSTPTEQHPMKEKFHFNPGVELIRKYLKIEKNIKSLQYDLLSKKTEGHNAIEEIKTLPKAKTEPTQDFEDNTINSDTVPSIYPSIKENSQFIFEIEDSSPLMEPLLPSPPPILLENDKKLDKIYSSTQKQSIPLLFFKNETKPAPLAPVVQNKIEPPQNTPEQPAKEKQTIQEKQSSKVRVPMQLYG